MTNKKLIEGVKIKELKVIPDERGNLMEILRADDEQFSKFGQVYITTARLPTNLTLIIQGQIHSWI